MFVEGNTGPANLISASEWKSLPSSKKFKSAYSKSSIMPLNGMEFSARSIVNLTVSWWTRLRIKDRRLIPEN